jgi:archaellum component FlaF (FlaF/FlaG flagellin family)
MAEILGFIKNVLEGWQVTVSASVIVVVITIITLVIWSAMRWRYRGIIKTKDATIDHIKESNNAAISVLKERIDLAKDQIEPLAREIERLNGTITTLNAQASAEVPHEQLAITILHVESIVVNITRLSDQLANTLVLNATEAPDIANFRVVVK